MNPVVVILKPEIAGNTNVVNFIINCFEGLNLILESRRLLHADRELIISHYHKDEAWLIEQGQRVRELFARDNIEHLRSPLEYGQQILNNIIDYMTSGPVLAILYSGKLTNLYDQVRELVGSTEPISATPGSLRHILSQDSYELANRENRALYNALHCSENASEAHREARLWFPDWIPD